MGNLKEYLNDAKEYCDFQEEQRSLHKKHSEIKEETVIVEKNVAVRETYRFLKTIAKSIIGILFILLSAIGITTLCYAELRDPFLQIVQQSVDMIF